uniref:Exportin-4 n=1 Tax=Plectus sambesii TaxID=2011161 RepID=A0A914WUI0_9BILA
MTSADQSLIAKLENAADIVLSPPNKVGHADRKAAEALFLELRNSKVPLEACKQVFETCQNEYVIYQTTRSLRESTLREWAVLEPASIEAVWKYVLQYAVDKANLSNYVTAELLQTVAMVLKRATFDTKAGDTDTFYSSIEQMVASGDLRLQGLACQAIQSLCTEYCTSWRSGDVGITWDFHMRSKRAFEATGLKRLLQLALQVLHQLVTNYSQFSSAHQVMICNRFLGLAETVLSWNFGSRLLPRRLTYAVEFGGSAALRPPGSWRDIFLDENFLTFFFQLHSKVRANQESSHHSMQCLIHLASLMGEVFLPPKDQPASSTDQQHDAYVRIFVQHTLNVFQSGPLAHEVLNFCQMISKLLSYHPLPSFVRLPPDTFKQFIDFLTQFGGRLCEEAIRESLSEDGDDNKYHEALAKLFDTWTILLRAEGRLIPENTFRQPTWELFTAFYRSVLSAPIGSRPLTSASSGGDVEQDIEQDDRELFADLLGPIGVFGRACMSDFLPLVSHTLSEKLSQFSYLLSSGGGDLSNLSVWQEDMHWLLLILGYTLTNEDGDGSCHVHGEVYQYSVDTFKTQGNISSEAGINFVSTCLRSTELATPEANVDAVMQLIGRVLQWSALEHRLLVAGQMSLLSPQLSQTSLWCVRRFVAAFTVAKDENDDDRDRGQPDPEEAMIPRLETGSEASSELVGFLLQKCFACLTIFSGEVLLAKDATQLLISLVDTRQRANEVASNANLLQEVARIDLQQLSPTARKELLRALVLIGAATDNSALQEQMYMMILDPLAARFQQLATADRNLSTTTESGLLDVLDCFRGVAQATQIHSAEFLFKYLFPVLESCVQLLNRWKDRQTVVDSVLGLFVHVTRKLAVYIDNKTNSEQLYACLLTLLRIYAENQLVKYHSKEMEEDKASDLVLVMEILSNVLSKDILVLAGYEDTGDALTSGSKVALTGLEMMMPLMNADLLRFPSLCTRFYRLVLYFTEMYPETIGQMPPHLIASLLECARLGLTSEYGTEVLQLCLEMIGQMATFVAQQDSNNPFVLQFKQALAGFLQPTFEACLTHSCEVDVFGDSANALYALVCCDRNAYINMVGQLIASHSDEGARAKLNAAFNQLLPPDAVVNPIRKEKREFRDRFEIFLNDIQGMLCLKH